MTSTVRRAGAFAALSTLSLAVPLVGPAPAAPIAAVVLAGVVAVRDGPLFDLFAYPGDYEDERLYGLATFVLAAAALGLLAAAFGLPIPVFVAAVVLVGYGNLAAVAAGDRTDRDVAPAVAFCLGGATAAVAGQTLARWLLAAPVEPALPLVVFVATSAGLLGALLRDVLTPYDDPIVMLAVGLLAWLLAGFEPVVGTVEIAGALAVTAAVGYAAVALGAASVAGMLTGTLLALLTIVLGGYSWFAVLMAFFGIGSVSTKFRYEEKRSRGIAQENDGARGSSNVLANSAVALAAVLGYAAGSADLLPVPPDPFLFAFAGSLATALSDTLSSEVGGVFDTPRLITTLKPVDPGTDGAVTWQGELAGIAGAAAVAGIVYALFPTVGAAGAAVVVVAGVVGMTVDSLLGATIEGGAVGNQGVNFLATLSGALVGALAVFLF
ncbi:DUF92 domain-containing protein [Saliphagus infecundisoli]|uniref:DUF92 domain-containing protein n=1 Tax=Saliphagus infecundisoli TaxID=1849069 RepID=A0ABD5QG86_9EURY|nr:DUF92 domain-containing protein [Saliphagus infecundisoli]